MKLWIWSLFILGELYESAVFASRAFPVGICTTPTNHYDAANGEQQAILDKVVAAAQVRATKDRTVAVMFAGSTYKSIVMNWLYAVTASKINNILIMSLDSGLHRLLQDVGAPSFYHAGAVDTFATLFNMTLAKRVGLAKVWAYRIVVIEALLHAGLNVVHTDSDVVLFPNAIEQILALPGDVVVQPGGMPKNVAQKWGNAACLGLTVFRPTERTLLLFELQRAFFVHSECDDQIAFNYALLTCTTMMFRLDTWDSTRPYLFGQRLTTALKTNPVFGHARTSQNGVLRGLTVTFISTSVAPRRHGPCGLQSAKRVATAGEQAAAFVNALAETPNAVAFHCNSATGKALQSFKRLKHFGLYFVDENRLKALFQEKAAKNSNGGSAATAAVSTRILCLGNGRHPGAISAETCT